MHWAKQQKLDLKRRRLSADSSIYRSLFYDGRNTASSYSSRALWELSSSFGLRKMVIKTRSFISQARPGDILQMSGRSQFLRKIQILIQIQSQAILGWKEGKPLHLCPPILFYLPLLPLRFQTWEKLEEWMRYCWPGERDIPNCTSRAGVSGLALSDPDELRAIAYASLTRALVHFSVYLWEIRFKRPIW